MGRLLAKTLGWRQRVKKKQESCWGREWSRELGREDPQCSCGVNTINNSMGKIMNSFSPCVGVGVCVCVWERERERGREGGREKSSNKNYHFHSNLHYTQGFRICYFTYSHLLSYLLSWKWVGSKINYSWFLPSRVAIHGGDWYVHIQL